MAPLPDKVWIAPWGSMPTWGTSRVAGALAQGVNKITAYLIFLSSPEAIFSLLFRERQRGREERGERQKHPCDREESISCLSYELNINSYWGWNPQRRYVPATFEPATFWLWDEAPTNWDRLASAKITLILKSHHFRSICSCLNVYLKECHWRLHYNIPCQLWGFWQATGLERQY